MNVPPTPTSPKSRATSGKKDLEELLRDGSLHHLARPPRAMRFSVWTVFFSLLVGFLAGILGELVVNAYLLEEGGFPIVTQNVAREKAKNENPEAVLAANKAILAVVRLTPLTGTTADAIPPDAFVGTAILLTDDGWGVSNSTVLQNEVGYAAVTADRRVLEIKHRIDDPASDLVFFQIDGGNYPVVSLTESVAENERMLALAGSGRQTLPRSRAVAVEQRSARRSGFLESSDAYSRFWMLDTNMSNAFLGGPVLDSRGRVAGVIVAGGDETAGAVAIPARAVGRVLQTLLSEKKVRRPVLGVNYIDLGATAGVPSAIRSGRSAGALVTGTPERAAVLAGSPAAGAGIQSGDILLRVAGQLLTEQVGLSAVIQDYQPGELIAITLLRDGKEQELRLTLNEQVPR